MHVDIIANMQIAMTQKKTQRYMCRRTSRSHFCADTWLIAKINRVAAWERIMVLYVVGTWYKL